MCAGHCPCEEEQAEGLSDSARVDARAQQVDSEIWVPPGKACRALLSSQQLSVSFLARGRERSAVFGSPWASRFRLWEANSVPLNVCLSHYHMIEIVCLLVLQ